MIFRIEENKLTLKAVNGHIRSLSPFPLLNSKLIPPETILVGPIESDIYPGVVDLVISNKFQLILSNYGLSSSLLTPEREEEITRVKRQQYRFSLDEPACFEMTREILEKAFEMKKEAVRGYKNLYDEIDIDPFLSLKFAPEFKGERWRTFMFNEEATIAGEYWTVAGNVFDLMGWDFGARSRRPATNETNALLNYGYAILLSKVIGLVLAAGLDPFVGFLHTLRSGRPSLCLDLMEPFRPIVDQVIIFIIHHELVKKSDFEVKKDGVVLGDDAKKVLSGKIIEALMTKYRYSLQMVDLVNEIRQKVLQHR